MRGTEFRTSSSPEVRNSPAFFSRKRLMLSATLVLGLAVGGSGLAFILHQNQSRVALAGAELSTPTPTVIKPVVRAHHITNNPNYCRDAVSTFRQTQPADSGCPTPTPMEAKKVDKSVAGANDHSSWGLVTEKAAEQQRIPTVTLTPTPEISVPDDDDLLVTPTPTIPPEPSPPLPPHLQCENFPLDDDWAHECRKIRGY